MCHRGDNLTGKTAVQATAVTLVDCHSSLPTKEATCPNGCGSTSIELFTMSVESQLKRNLEGEKFIL